MMDYIPIFGAALFGGFCVVAWSEWRQKRPIWSRRGALKKIAALDKELKSLPTNDNDDSLLEAEKRAIEVRSLDARISKATSELGK